MGDFQMHPPSRGVPGPEGVSPVCFSGIWCSALIFILAFKEIQETYPQTCQLKLGKLCPLHRSGVKVTLTRGCLLPKQHLFLPFKRSFREQLCCLSNICVEHWSLPRPVKQMFLCLKSPFKTHRPFWSPDYTWWYKIKQNRKLRNDDARLHTAAVGQEKLTVAQFSPRQPVKVQFIPRYRSY